MFWLLLVVVDVGGRDGVQSESYCLSHRRSCTARLLLSSPKTCPLDLTKSSNLTSKLDPLRSLDLLLQPPGDVLIFLTGQEEIEACEELLKQVRGLALFLLAASCPCFLPDCAHTALPALVLAQLPASAARCLPAFPSASTHHPCHNSTSPLFSFSLSMPAEDPGHGQQDRGAADCSHLRQPALGHAGGCCARISSTACCAWDACTLGSSCSGRAVAVAAAVLQ